MPTNSSINTTNPIGIVSGGTNTASFSNQYGVVYYNGSQLVSTPSGSTGTVLRSNGASMAPSFQGTPRAGGAWVLIQTLSAPGGSGVTFTLYPATYNNYAFLVSATVMQNGNPLLQCQISSNGGSTWNDFGGWASDLSGSGGQTNGTNLCLFAGFDVLNQYPAGIVWLYSANSDPFIISKCVGVGNSPSFKVGIFTGGNTTSNCNSFRFISNGNGSIPEITVSQYGVLS